MIREIGGEKGEEIFSLLLPHKTHSWIKSFGAWTRSNNKGGITRRGNPKFFFSPYMWISINTSPKLLQWHHRESYYRELTISFPPDWEIPGTVLHTNCKRWQTAMFTCALPPPTGIAGTWAPLVPHIHVCLSSASHQQRTDRLLQAFVSRWSILNKLACQGFQF